MSQMKEAVASASFPCDRSRRQAGGVAAAQAQPGYPNRRTKSGFRTKEAALTAQPPEQVRVLRPGVAELDRLDPAEHRGASKRLRNAKAGPGPHLSDGEPGPARPATLRARSRWRAAQSAGRALRGKPETKAESGRKVAIHPSSTLIRLHLPGLPDLHFEMSR